MNDMKMMRRYFKLIITPWLAIFTMPAVAGQPFGCLIEPYQVAEIGSQVIGIVESIKVERGDYVKKGQILAVLKSDVERASVDAAHARAEADANIRAAAASLEFDKQRLRRSEGLLQKNFISKQALDQVAAETKVSEQKLRQAQEQKRIAERELTVANAQASQHVIRSPFDGVIADRYMSVGERIEEKPLVKVAKIDQLRVQVVVPVAYYGKIDSNATAMVMPDFPDALVVMAQVSLIDKLIDAASNTFRVQLDLANPDLKLPAGLRCKADFGIELPSSNNASKPLPSAPATAPSPAKPQGVTPIKKAVPSTNPTTTVRKV